MTGETQVLRYEYEIQGGSKLENIIRGKEVGKGYFQGEDGRLYLSEGTSDGLLTSVDDGDLYIIAERDQTTEAVVAIKQF